MRIEKQVTRLIISDYDNNQKSSILGAAYNFFKGGLSSKILTGTRLDEINTKVLKESNEGAKLKSILSGEDFEFFYERDGEIILPVGVFNIVMKMFPNARVTETGPWPCDKLKFVTDPLPQPRNKLQGDAIRFIYSNSKYVAATLPAGSGKEEPYSNLIPTPDGVKPMKNIKVGDRVFSPDGTTANVVQTFENGVKDIFKLTFADGRTARCGREHLWHVRTKNNDQYATMTTDELIRSFNKDDPYCVPRNNAVKYYVDYLEIDPRVFGIMLGCVTYDQKKDEFIIDDKIDSSIKIRLKRNLPKASNMFKPSKKCLISGKQYIPNKYKYDDIIRRKQVIFGISEILGVYDDNDNVTIRTDSKQLADDIRYMLWSLGCSCKVEEGNVVHFNMNEMIEDKHDTPYLEIVKIEPDGREECKCIMVDKDDRLYLTKDFIVTHNTFMSSYTSMKLDKKTIIFVPTTNLKKQWAESLMGLFKVPADRITEVNEISDLQKDADWFIMIHATLSNFHKRYNMEEEFRNAHIGTKIIDETHMFFKNVLLISCLANFENNIHLTATFGRSSDEQNKLFHRAFADIPKFDYKKKNFLGDEVYPQKHHVHLYSINVNSGVPKSLLRSMTTYKYGLNIAKYAGVVFPDNNTLTRFEKDVLNVVKRVVNTVPYGKMLFLFPTINASEKMCNVIQKMYPDKTVRALNSSHTKPENEETLKVADIICSTSKSSGTGLDIKGLSVVIAAEQYKSPILSEQMFGRLRERPDGKDTYYFDITDLSSSQLVNWRNSRMKVMRPRAKSFQITRTSDIAVKIYEEYEWYRYLYNEGVELGLQYSQLMEYVNELLYYI